MNTVVVDCDPGIDDALALALAFSHPHISVRAVTTVAGNVAIEHVTQNALDLVSFFGAPETPVIRGAECPMERDAVRASVHGVTGLAGFQPPRSVHEAASGATDYLIDTVMGSPEDEITLIAIGPLTNLALAVQKQPRIAQRVKRVVIMGGGRGVGNMTPVAEFNVFADPHAADIVMTAGWEIVMLGLDVTWQSGITQAELDRIRHLDGPKAEAALAWINHYVDGETNPAGPGPAVHDVCAVAWVADPSLFDVRPAYVRVETESELTLGETVVDLDLISGHPANVSWALSIDRGRFWDLMLSALEA
jgi:purine nucleosidase